MLNDADMTAAVDNRTNLERTRADLTAKLAGLRDDLRVSKTATPIYPSVRRAAKGPRCRSIGTVWFRSWPP